MAIKKNAAKANIGPKKQVKATFAECTAEDPLKCRYHGPKMLQAELDKLMGKGAAKVKKTKNGYEITSDDAYDAYNKVAAMLPNAKGSLGFKKAVFILGDGGFVTPEGEAELEDADTLSSEEDPKKDKAPSEHKDPFEELENLDIDALADELETDLLDNYNELESVAEEAAEDLEAELLGNTEFDDDVFADATEEGSVLPEITEADCVALMKAAGINPNEFADDAPSKWLEVITNGNNAYGVPISGDVLKLWQGIAEKADYSGEDLPALSVLKNTLSKLESGAIADDGASKPKELTSDDIVETFSPTFIGDLASDKEYQNIYEHIIKNHNNPSGSDLTQGQLAWFAEASQIAHAAGVNNYALELLDKMLADKGVLKNENRSNASDMEKYAAQWNNLMDTAINGKKLIGTQYWAENIQPIVESYNDAVEAQNPMAASDAIVELKEAVQKAPDGAVEKPTMESLTGEMDNIIAKMKDTGLDLTWDAKKGNALGKAFEDAVNANNVEGAAKALQEFKDYISFLESGGDMPDDMEEELTTEDIKDFFKKCGIKKESLLSDANLAATKEALETGKWNGKPLTKGNKKWYEAMAKKAPNHKVANAINEMLSADKMKPKKIKKGSAKEILSAALGGSSEPIVAKGMLKPLEHDESKFPIGVTKEVLDKALSDSSAKALGGASGDNATLIVIDGRKYVCKKGSGSHAEHIHNEVLADQAYRAGGVRVPDCQEYVFGNYTYKLAEFIEGKSLSSYMASATAAQQEKLRKDLLAGFPMDVLLSNWDVIGTSRDNIIVDADGHGWRIDNGGSFDMAAMSNKKTMAWAVEEYITKPEQKHKPPLAAFENWDNEGGWAHRQWIDDFRTMRVDPKNKGLFDQYSTAEIFLSAANLDFANAVSGLPQELKDAIAKPLFEMRAMAHQAWCAKEAGYSTAHSMAWKDADGKTHITPVDTVSAALDAIYEAHKDGCREWLQKKTTWGNLGWLSSGSGNGSGYQKKVFPEDAPPEPLPPPKGTDLTAPILTAIISINHHIKQGDYTPNQTSIKKAMEVKPILEMLVAEHVENAKELLDAIHKIENAAKDGYKKQLTFDTPDGLFDAKGLSLKFDSVHEAMFKKHNAQKHTEWQKAMDVYLAKKKAWDEIEEGKAKAAGAAPENSFGEYEDKLIEANIDTNGIPRGGGKPKCNHDSKSAQKGTSFSMVSCKKKVRQYAMMGIPLEAMYFKNGDKVFYNGNTKNGGSHVSGHNTSEKDFFAAIDFYRENPEIFRQDMEAYARHKGMMALVHMNIDNSAINTHDGTVFVMRGEHKQAWGKNGINKPTGKSRIIDRYPIDSSTSAQINKTGIMGDVHIGWKLPIWRISDNFMISTKGVNSGNDGEYEICINPIQIPYPPMFFSEPDVLKGSEHCMKLYLQQPQIKGSLDT